MATNVRPNLTNIDVNARFVHNPSVDRVVTASPRLQPKEAGIRQSYDYHAFPRPTGANRLTFSYNNEMVDPGAPHLPRGITCPNCTNHNTAFAHMRTPKEDPTPIWNCLDKIVNARYPINPCLACAVCQVNDSLMGRLWHRCEAMVHLNEPALFLAPNYRDRGAEICLHCGHSPNMVTCMCRLLFFLHSPPVTEMHSTSCNTECSSMTFNSMMNMAQEQRCLSNHASRKEKNRTKSATRQATRQEFPGVPEDSPLFSALHTVNAKNPERLKDLPARARANFGQHAPHEDEEGEHEHLTSCAPTATHSAVGILRQGVLLESRNGNTLVGHSRTPAQRTVARIGGVMPPAIISQGRVLPSQSDQVHIPSFNCKC